MKYTGAKVKFNLNTGTLYQKQWGKNKIQQRLFRRKKPNFTSIKPQWPWDRAFTEPFSFVSWYDNLGTRQKKKKPEGANLQSRLCVHPEWLGDSWVISYLMEWKITDSFLALSKSTELKSGDDDEPNKGAQCFDLAKSLCKIGADIDKRWTMRIGLSIVNNAHFCRWPAAKTS